MTGRLSLDQNDTNALINKGNVLYEMGRFQEAVDSFTAANQTDPGNSAAIAWPRPNRLLPVQCRRR